MISQRNQEPRNPGPYLLYLTNCSDPSSVVGHGFWNPLLLLCAGPLTGFVICGVEGSAWTNMQGPMGNFLKRGYPAGNWNSVMAVSVTGIVCEGQSAVVTDGTVTEAFFV